MSHIDNDTNNVFDLLLSNSVLFRKCEDHYNGSSHLCLSCGEVLEYAYMENRLYAIKCPICKTVTLVRERNPREAACLVGYERYDDE